MHQRYFHSNLPKEVSIEWCKWCNPHGTTRQEIVNARCPLSCSYCTYSLCIRLVQHRQEIIDQSTIRCRRNNIGIDQFTIESHDLLELDPIGFCDCLLEHVIDKIHELADKIMAGYIEQSEKCTIHGCFSWQFGNAVVVSYPDQSMSHDNKAVLILPCLQCVLYSVRILWVVVVEYILHLVQVDLKLWWNLVDLMSEGWSLWQLHACIVYLVANLDNKTTQSNFNVFHVVISWRGSTSSWTTAIV